jgi:4-aminobutyrate aminotransferase
VHSYGNSQPPAQAGNVVRIIPALNVTSDEIQAGLTRFTQALKTATS